MLRIAVDEEGGYTIPVDNPFTGFDANIPDEIWATGLRNPWRFSFDRSTGDLWIGDVGQDAFEEINKVPADEGGGLDFGWRCWEGNDPLIPTGCAEDSTFYYPIYTYPTTRNVGESVTGGYVYRGEEIPDLQGKYIYGDYVSGNIWSLEELPSGEVLNEQIAEMDNNNLSSFGENAAGELFVAGHRLGKIFRLVRPIVSSNISFLNLETFSITPNPFTHFLRIQFETSSTNFLTFQLRNVLGQLLEEKRVSAPVNGNTIAFEVAHLPPGNYILSITNGKDTLSKKLIKK